MIQKAKRTLAMLMAAVMLCGLLPVSAMATTTEQDPVDATTTPVVTEQPEATEQPAATETPAPSETVLPTEQPEETLPDEDTPTAGLPEEVVEPYALTYEELLASTMKEDQPFASGTLGSDNFRIPALVTLSDGTLVAAADARWDHTYDGKNVDTMVAVSDDNGQSWTTSLVNYFADTENKENDTAASFIDPALATDGKTVYLLVDVFPGGVNLIDATCKTGTGYDSNGKLMLKNSKESEYNYYVGDFTNGFAPVVKKDGTKTEYAVNERYDLYKKNENDEYVAENYRNDGNDGAYIAANVFYENAEFTVFPTSYLWLVKSTDDGKTWSAPQILNAQVKYENEAFLGVGPGRGVVTSDGTIYFSCYYHDGSELGASSQRSSLIYSKDDGATWKRTENLQSSGSSSSKWSSENQVVQLDDGTIRMFYRNGRGLLCYADLKGDGWSAPTALDPEGDYICSNCQLSVIHYSKKINGKESIVVSCPAQYEKGDWGSATSGSRENGKIFVFTLDENNTMSVAYTYELTAAGEYFAYSCLTELENGDIGILYENGAASITYEKISLNAILGQPESGEFPQITENGSILAGTKLSMKQDDAAKTLNVELEEGQILSATSSNDAVLKAEVGENGTFTLTPVGEGTAVVTLTITSAAGVQSRNASADLTKTLQIDVTAPAVATYGFIGNTGDGNTGKDKPVTKLTTNVGQSYSVLLNVSTDGQTVEWTSDNPGVATVSNGTITATGQGSATITATVKNSDGTTAGTATMPVAVIRGEPNGVSHWDFSFYIDEITHTSVYYSADASSTMVPVQEGEVFYIKIRFMDKYAFAFFGAPEEGYALTDMRAPGTEGQYYPLHKNGVIEKNDEDYFFNGDIGKNFRNLYDKEWFQEKYTYTRDMVNAAIKKDCDGGMGFTKGTAAIKNPSSSLTFRSEKLPTLTKTVVSVNGVPYREGMVAHVGDEVVFRITVTKYASQTGITYTNAIVTDNALPGVNLNENITEYLKGNGANTWTYDVTYTIQKGDLDQPIKNTADLTYNYQSQYSTGAMSSSATAEASITAAKFNPGSYVVDFGLPVTFDFTSDEKPAPFESGSSSSGVAKVDVSADGNRVTYTLNKPMTEPDTVILTDEDGGTNSFTIYPATTVYYDASFIQSNGTPIAAHDTTNKQTASKVGSHDRYGYEEGYSNSVSGKLPGDGATFTFTGTGVDIYANPTSTSCYVAVRIYDSTDNLVQLYVVDTAMKAGTTTYTTVPTSQSYNVPIVSELGLEYGTYTVNIQRVNPEKANVSGRNNVVLNGFRVYGTLANGADNGVYTQDNEASPTFTQLRDVLINTLWKTYSGAVKLDEQYDQVYANPKTEDMTASIGNELTANDAQDLLINGPKNEIYLTNGQTLTITVPAGDYQIGLKALNAASGTVSINSTPTTVTNVDMFYKVKGPTITIENTDSARIAVTYLKKTGE